MTVSKKKKKAPPTLTSESSYEELAQDLLKSDDESINQESKDGPLAPLKEISQKTRMY